jgi:hypothetical protein
MASQYIKDYYLKLKIIKNTHNKQIWLVKNTLNSDTAIAKIQYTYDSYRKNRTVLH